MLYKRFLLRFYKYCQLISTDRLQVHCIALSTGLHYRKVDFLILETCFYLAQEATYICNVVRTIAKLNESTKVKSLGTVMNTRTRVLLVPDHMKAEKDQY